MPGSAQRRLAQPSSGGFTLRSGDAVPRRGRAEVAGAVHTQGAALPSDDQSSAHAHAAHTPACPVRTPRSQALTHARMHTPGTVLAIAVLHMQKAPSLLHPLRLWPSLASRERFTYSLAHQSLRGETAVDLLPSPLPASEAAPQRSAAPRGLP